MPEFDLVAPVYDETRRPPHELELGTVLKALGGARDVLEGGIGTGRFARPLTDQGVRVTGVDLSRGMMQRAREKGLARLVQGDLLHLPFHDASFDAALLVHVLQLVPSPEDVLLELARVASDRVVAQLPELHHGGSSRRGDLRRRYLEIASEMGWQAPSPPRYWGNSERVLALAPPDRIEVAEVTPPGDTDPERVWKDLRSFGGLIVIPPEVHERVVARLREEMGPRELPHGPRHRSLRVAVWDAGALRAVLRAKARPAP